MLVVPDRFDKNAKDVHEHATHTETGTWLLEYLCERLGLPDLGRHEVLDFGCGNRFAQAIVNCRIPVKSYVGIDIDEEMIDFLIANVSDPRLSFAHFNARNPHYNPRGEPMSAATVLPVGTRTFDIICMFSVITHQFPADAEAIFTLLRRHVKEDGRLFFSAAMEQIDSGYAETIPDRPTALSIYSPDLLRGLLDRTGWEILSIEGRNPRDLPILDSLVCSPRAFPT